LTRNFVGIYLALQEFIAESGAKSPHADNFTGTAAEVLADIGTSMRLI
jgi:hypothetical protein